MKRKQIHISSKVFSLLMSLTILSMTLTGCASSTQSLEASSLQGAAKAPAISSLDNETAAAGADLESVEQNQSTEETGVDSSVREQSTDSTLEPYTLTGSMRDIGCYGNLLYVGDTYYTMTEHGPKPVEIQSINTTVELYGTWDLNLDYAIIDGALVFRDKSVPFDNYAMIDGEKVFQSDYYEHTDEEDIDWSIEWLTPNAATVTPVEGSTDMVTLTIRRSDKSEVETCHYSFFYNLSTGEITDPLGNISGLFDHGNLSSVQFNAARDKALALIFEVDTLPSGERAIGEGHTYLCDFSTGTMARISDLLSPYLSDADVQGAEVSEAGSCRWGGADTVLSWMTEAIPVETTDEDADPWERHSCLFVYDAAAGSLRCKLRDVTQRANHSESAQPYLGVSSEDDDSSEYKILDTNTGKIYVPSETAFQNVDLDDWDETNTHAVLQMRDGGLCFVDCEKMLWTDLADKINLPNDEIQTIVLISGQYLCLAANTTTYCYVLPDGIATAQLLTQ